MLVQSLLPVLLTLATEALKKKRNSKLVKWLVSEKTQNTVATFFAAYTSAVTEIEEEEED